MIADLHTLLSVSFMRNDFLTVMKEFSNIVSAHPKPSQFSVGQVLLEVRSSDLLLGLIGLALLGGLFGVIKNK